MRKGKKERKNGAEKGKKTRTSFPIEDAFSRPEPLECYVFNDALDPLLDDGACEHCRFFLTTRCPHVDEFIEEVEDMELDL
ncbi:MAG: hypothetical protein QXJ27_07305 [Thermoplasmata archaeon]